MRYVGRPLGETKMPWGPYEGRTFDDIASDITGERYLTMLGGRTVGGMFANRLHRYLSVKEAERSQA